MIHRIMLAAALLTVPAIAMADQPVATSTHAQQADTKPKPKTAKKHKKAGKKAAPKAAAVAPKDSGMAKPK
jgi:hypothetical protein